MTEKPKLKKKPAPSQQQDPVRDRLDTQKPAFQLGRLKEPQNGSSKSAFLEDEQTPLLPQGDPLAQSVNVAEQSEVLVATSNHPKQQSFGFGLGKMKELTEAFKKAQRVEQDVKKLQQDLESTNLASGSENKVLAVFNGIQSPVRVTIATELMSESAETIAAEVLTTVKDAYTQSRRLMQSKMKEIADSLKISVNAVFPNDSE